MSEICGIILAAGESKRMKSPKMLLPFGDSTIIENVILKVNGSAVNELIVVLGSYREEILNIIGGMHVKHCF